MGMPFIPCINNVSDICYFHDMSGAKLGSEVIRVGEPLFATKAVTHASTN